ncbi:hypothetical protein BDW72DRAFT_179245 [Aspergillus terricola var. indicus]
MAKYSTRTTVTFTPRTAQIATLVESKPSISETTTGATSLQKRSTRLIEAFRSLLETSNASDITTAQSLSTETVLTVAASFSTPASRTSAMNNSHDR